MPYHYGPKRKKVKWARIDGSSRACVQIAFFVLAGPIMALCILMHVILHRGSGKNQRRFTLFFFREIIQLIV